MADSPVAGWAMRWAVRHEDWSEAAVEGWDRARWGGARLAGGLGGGGLVDDAEAAELADEGWQGAARRRPGFEQRGALRHYTSRAPILPPST